MQGTHFALLQWRVVDVAAQCNLTTIARRTRQTSSDKSATASNAGRYAQCKMIRQLSILPTIFLMTISFSIYSQTSDTLKAKRVIITTSLTDYLPTIKLNTGNFNIGSEIYLKDRKSIYANFGLIKSYGQPRGLLSISSLSTQGMKIQIEGRQYLNLHKIFEPAILLFWPHIFQYKSQTLPNTGYYVAIHSSYQWTATKRQETVVDYIDNNPFPNSTSNN